MIIDINCWRCDKKVPVDTENFEFSSIDIFDSKKDEQTIWFTFDVKCPTGHYVHFGIYSENSTMHSPDKKQIDTIKEAEQMMKEIFGESN